MSAKNSLRFPEESFSDGAAFDFFKPHSSVGMSDWGPSLTRQEFADDCDINTLMARYEITGELPRTAVAPHYADYTDVPDLMTAMAVMSEAQDSFMRLPASVRREFENDPIQFVAFAQDPDNLDQMRLWGLAPPKPAEPPPVAPTVVETVSPVAPAKPPGEVAKPA